MIHTSVVNPARQLNGSNDLNLRATQAWHQQALLPMTAWAVDVGEPSFLWHLPILTMEQLRIQGTKESLAEYASVMEIYHPDVWSPDTYRVKPGLRYAVTPDGWLVVFYPEDRYRERGKDIEVHE